MGLKSELAEDVLTVYVHGDIDHHSARPLREQIDECVERVQPSELRLDFGGVSFMDSSGVGLIMGRYRLINGFGGKLTLREVPRELEKMMRIAGLDRLPIWGSEEKKGDEGNEACE